MGIKLQSATLVDEFEYISLHDSAMDTEAEEFAEKFAKYREGTTDAPPLKDGETPAVWTLKPITDARLKAMLDGVREEHGQAAWAVAVAAAGIKSVSGIKGEDGKAFKLRFVREEGYPIICNEDLNSIGAAILHEIGMVILTHQSPS